MALHAVSVCDKVHEALKKLPLQKHHLVLKNENMQVTGITILIFSQGL